MVKRYTERHYKTREDKDVLQEIVRKAQLTTLSLSHPHTTKDGTEPYPANPSEGSYQELQGEQALDVQESALFLRDRLYEGPCCRRKGKRYATEVVMIAEKVPPDNLEDIKDNVGKAQSQQDNDKETKSRGQS